MVSLTSTFTSTAFASASASGLSRVFALALVAVSLSGGCAPVAFQAATTIPVEPKQEVAAQKRVELTDDRIVIREKIQFEANKAVILPESFDLLAEIAQVINQNPRVKKIRIEGHASSEGNPKVNDSLSRRRAAAVMAHLKKKGKVAGSRMASAGYGSQQPIASNDSLDGREKNRRVEFMIVEQEYTQHKVEVDAAGNRTVLESSAARDAAEETAPTKKAKKAK